MKSDDDSFKNNVALLLADHSALLHDVLEKCQECEENLVTVTHGTGKDGYIQHRLCDRCAAEAVCNATTAYVCDPAASGARELLRLMDVALWIDVPDAINIRRIVAHVEAMNEGKPPRREKMH